MSALTLPDGRRHTLGAPGSWARPAATATSRVAFAAAHVVADPRADGVPGGPAAIDWDATLAFRRHLWSWGLGVADAMDTAQRGTGLDWVATQELIRRSATEAAAGGHRLACGAATDHAPARLELAGVVRAYEEQAAYVESSGAQVVLMASRQLAAAARGPEDYAEVYGRLLAQVAAPVILHWLGPMFDPLLAGYWGCGDPHAALDSILAIIAAHPGRVDGVKLSMLDLELERELRRRLPAGVRCYTGDDLHYPELIRGDDSGESDALLGVLDPLAPIAAGALAALDKGDPDGFSALLDPTVPLARKLFAAPTPAYKTGIVFLAWLAGHQDGFVMLGGATGLRSVPHLAEVFVLADALGLFPDPELAAHRMRVFLEVGGVPQ
jgi:hypothetical protein